ncbi:MAG: purine-binding chemotaxis protein CheW [Betaproteobacteria bacterium]|nr:purine-binding chemotaxis protein CheW [Betaproteobacteria bacterium]
MRENAGLSHLVVFTLDDGRYGLELSTVERVVRAVDITPLPKAPDIVSGVINVRGRIVPVMNVRRRFRLPERPINLSDQLVVAHTSRRAVALMVDAVSGTVECSPDAMVAADRIVPDLQYVAGVVRTRDGMILIHDLDTFLGLDEEQALGAALANL